MLSGQTYQEGSDEIGTLFSQQDPESLPEDVKGGISFQSGLLNCLRRTYTVQALYNYWEVSFFQETLLEQSRDARVVGVLLRHEDVSDKVELVGEFIELVGEPALHQVLN